MKSFRRWLGAALALQCLLATALLWAGRPVDDSATQQPFLSLTPAAIDRIVIAEGDQTTTLVRQDGEWQLPELADLPAQQTKVTELLSKLEALRTGWPVTRSSTSHERFQVAADNHQRHITLYQGETTAGELFVGSSPGLRQVHLRRAGEDEVYTGELPTHEVPAKPDQWLDKQLLAAGTVDSVKGPGYHLHKQDEGWAFTDKPDAVAADDAVAAEKVRQLASGLEGLRVTGVVDAIPENAETIVLEVSAGDSQWQYTFAEAEGKHYVSRDDHKPAFTLSSYYFDRVANLDSATLTAPEADQTGETAQQTASGETQVDKG